MRFQCDQCNACWQSSNPNSLWGVAVCPFCNREGRRVPEPTSGIGPDVLAVLPPEQLERLSFGSKGAQYPPAYRILWQLFQRLAKERADTVELLKRLTAELEDNHWVESAPIPVIIEHHLWRHLAEEDWPALSVEGRQR